MTTGAWQALWMGEAPDRRYAAFHPAPGRATTGALLVPPLFHEMPRSRRFLTEVASEVAAAGLPCLRFDFLGTGDSGGRGEVQDFDSMCADLDLAAATLRELAQVQRLVALAWRAGALVVDAWLARGGAVDHVVSWEPVPDGADWLRELVECDRIERDRRPPPRPGVARTSDASDGQLMGFPVSPRLRGELEAFVPGRGTRRGNGVAWAIFGSGGGATADRYTRTFRLPAGAPSFSRGAAMDATFFLTPAVRATVAEMARALRQGTSR